MYSWIRRQRNRFVQPDAIIQARGGGSKPSIKISCSEVSDLNKSRQSHTRYGNPDVQISDNGPPFNSVQMQNFAKDKDITLQKSPPLHPASDPVETFMRPLGKAMKIGRHNGIPENETLRNVLKNYRQTPHPATGLPPAAMLFRHEQRLDFPRRHATEEDITIARESDRRKKMENDQKVNSFRYSRRYCADQKLQ